MIRHEMQDQTHVVTIDDVSELPVVSTTALSRISVNAGRLAARRSEYRSDWIGASLEQINTYLRTGWPEGVALVQKLADELKAQLPTPKSYRRKQKWADDGDEPSWEREQAGHDEIWRTSRRETQRGPTTVNRVASWGGNAGLQPDALKWSGVVLAVLIDLLEASGYRCGASVAHAVSFWNQPGKYAVTQITVKEPNMPLDLASLVPVVAHPGVFRVHGINATSLAPFDVTSGHGSCIEVSALPKNVSILQQPNTIILRNTYSEQAARAEILRVLALFNDPQ
jgi:hypothetical protein